MEAVVGNWLLVRGRVLDAPSRLGQILGSDGTPSYVIRWTDDDRTSVVFSGSGAVLLAHPPATRVSG
ncbi:MAG: uncharacterized protein JWQ03_3187 [Variovorax sp.]|nr:uncharacterized protein [Variovorax sp.]